MKAPVRPGTGTKRPAAPRASKSLVRVLEDDSQKWRASRTRPGDVLARMRSATPAAIPGVKREGSEPLGLDRIPLGERSLKEKSRNVLSRTMSNNSTADLKALKKEEETRQIQEAISGIRKPNRHLIGRSIIEDAEKRTGSSSSPHPKSELQLSFTFDLELLLNFSFRTTQASTERCCRCRQSGTGQSDTSELPLQGRCIWRHANLRQFQQLPTKEGLGRSTIF